MRSLISGQWELVEDLRGGLEVAGLREAAMKPSREDEAEPAGGPWEECFEVAVQLALRAGQVSAAALLSGPGRVRVSAAPPGGAATLPHHTHLGLTKVRAEVKSDQRGSSGPGIAGPRTACSRGPGGLGPGRGWGSSSAELDPRAPASCGGRLVTADPGVIQ